MTRSLQIAAGLTAVLVAARAEQQAPSYDLDESVRIGLQRSGIAANARRDQAIAGEWVRQARSEALPQISASAGYTRLDELQEIDFDGSSFELGTLDTYRAGAAVNQLLFSGGRVLAALRAARLSEGYAEWARRETEAVLALAIRTGFHDILLARAAVDVRRASLTQFESLLEQTQTRLNNGTASEFDLLSARVKVANEKPRLLQAQNDHAIAREDFRRLVGLDDGPFSVSGELTFHPLDVDLPHLLRLAVAKRPAVRRAELGVRLREEDAIAARSGVRPSLSAFGAYDGANDYGFDAGDEWEWHWTAGLSLSWDLWDGGLTRSVVAEKTLDHEKSIASLDELIKTVRLDVRRAYLELVRARESVAAAGDNVTLAAKALDIAAARQESGLGTHLEFTDANVALSTARLTRLQALRDHLVGVARLVFACGCEDETALTGEE